MPKPAATEAAINKAKRCLADQRMKAIYMAERVFSTRVFIVHCG